MTDLLADEPMLVERIELGLHLAACRRCRTHVQQLLATVEVLRALPDHAMPAVMRFEPFHLFGGGGDR